MKEQMKTNINKYYFVLLLTVVLLLVIIPLKVSALDINSDYYEYNKTNHLIEFKNIDVSFSFFAGSVDSNNSKRIYIYGLFNNPNYLDDTIYTKTLFFDSNKEIVATCASENSLIKNKTVTLYCSVDEANFINNKTIDDVKFYKILISENVPISSLEESNYNDNPNIYDENSTQNSLSNLDYVLNSYDINIIVNENNTLKITEKIGAYFYKEKHGIYRKIPLKNTITRLDGTTSKNRTQISEIKVNDNYSLSNEDGYKVIKIGNANSTLLGQKNYEISYLYNLGKDPSKKYDELYFNLIGDEWDTSISNITFTITMPKEFDATKLGFSSGKKGSTDSSKIIYNINGNTISGSFDGTLDSNEAITLRLELPEGYFINAGIKMSFTYYLMFIIPLLGLLISFILWKKYGKDKPIIQTVEFYPPQGLNSLDIGYLYKGHADTTDVISLLIYLANQGYIKITETDQKNFKITKLKEYDGNNNDEKLFLKRLFNGKDSTTNKSLKNRFYTTINRLIDNTDKNKDKIFEKTKKKNYIIIILFLFISLLTITIIPIGEYSEMDCLYSLLAFSLFYIPFILIVILANLPFLLRISWSIIIFSVFFFNPQLLDALSFDYHYIISLIFGIICIIGMTILFKLMPKRTEYGNEMLGKILGFKKFLETAEKQKLEAMVMENPTYFYDILPYAYVLGVSNKWIEKFETIALQSPDWYDGNSMFNIRTFKKFVNSTMSTAYQDMSSSPSRSSSTSGRSSGGGSSGGGSW